MAARSRIFVNGFPLLIMQAISARSRGASVYQIERAIEQASGYAPSAGAVFSALNTLQQHDQVQRRLEEDDGQKTYVFSLTDRGEARRRWMVEAIAKAEAPVADDGKRVRRSPGRWPRGSKATDCPSEASSSGP